MAWMVLGPDERLVPEVDDALCAWARACHAANRAIGIGVGLVLPQHSTKRTMRFVLPLLCAINPMGVVCQELNDASVDEQFAEMMRDIGDGERETIGRQRPLKLSSAYRESVSCAASRTSVRIVVGIPCVKTWWGRSCTTCATERPSDWPPG